MSCSMLCAPTCGGRSSTKPTRRSGPPGRAPWSGALVTDGGFENGELSMARARRAFGQGQLVRFLHVLARSVPQPGSEPRGPPEHGDSGPGDRPCRTGARSPPTRPAPGNWAAIGMSSNALCEQVVAGAEGHGRCGPTRRRGRWPPRSRATASSIRPSTSSAEPADCNSARHHVGLAPRSGGAQRALGVRLRIGPPVDEHVGRGAASADTGARARLILREGSRSLAPTTARHLNEAGDVAVVLGRQCPGPGWRCRGLQAPSARGQPPRAPRSGVSRIDQAHASAGEAKQQRRALGDLGRDLERGGQVMDRHAPGMEGGSARGPLRPAARCAPGRPARRPPVRWRARTPRGSGWPGRRTAPRRQPFEVAGRGQVLRPPIRLESVSYATSRTSPGRTGTGRAPASADRRRGSAARAGRGERRHGSSDSSERSVIPGQAAAVKVWPSTAASASTRGPPAQLASIRAATRAWRVSGTASSVEVPARTYPSRSATH